MSPLPLSGLSQDVAAGVPWVAGAILLLFVVAAAAMATRRLPALLALPLMALGIGLVEIAAGRLTPEELTRTILAEGALRLADPMVVILFGGILGVLLQRTGVAESIVRRGAEFAGDQPWVVALVMLALVALLFTTITGLGALIMVGTIVLPILASMGLREPVCAGVLLFGVSLGGLLQPANWTLYRTVLGMTDAQVLGYAVIVFAITALGAVAFVTIELHRARMLKVTWRAAVAVAAIGMLVVFGLLRGTGPAAADATGGPSALAVTLGLGLAALALGTCAVRLRRGATGAARVDAAGYLIPIVPLLLILVHGVPFAAAFVAGLLYAFLVTWRPGAVNLFTRACLEGGQGVMPALVLMIGLGMLLNAILGGTTPRAGGWPVLADMQLLLGALVPRGPVAYVLTFTLLAPLVLYRGPLNVWGLGYPIAGVLLAQGLPAAAILAMLLSVGIMQGVSDPTNTANVWVANEVRVDVNRLLFRTLPYTWAVALVGLVVAGTRAYAGA
ncbi:MAG: citrate transporter [Planctomycetes bacterium]|nr:citrate transporter [Planctomycetota bacterium]